MKTFLLFLSCFAFVASQDIFLNATNMDLLKLLGNVTQVRSTPVTPDEIKFFLITRSTPKTEVKSNELLDYFFDHTKATKFLVHGFLENNNVTYYREITEEYLKYGDFNIFQVDWQDVGRSIYFSSAKNSRMVGEIMARFIINLNIPPHMIHLIGHSLGAHVCSFAAKEYFKETGNKIRRISALDPAGPYFQLISSGANERLDKDDADIVDVIHTDGGFFGFLYPLGTLDIYANGGTRRQPGCREGRVAFTVQKTLAVSSCSHTRSHQYFVHSINNAIIVCRKCANYLDMTLNRCNNGKYVIRHQEISEKFTGICAVKTSSKPPYFNTDVYNN